MAKITTTSARAVYEIQNIASETGADVSVNLRDGSNTFVVTFAASAAAEQVLAAMMLRSREIDEARIARGATRSNAQAQRAVDGVIAKIEKLL
jgi:hypothetical protein